MITIISNDEISLTNFDQEVYDQILEQADFKNIECDCGGKGQFVKIGFYTRTYKSDTKKIKIKIQRVLCKHCGKSHAVFVEWMVPASMMLVTTQLQILRAYYNHQLEEFLVKYPTIDRSNVFYIINNYKNKWKKYLQLAKLTLADDIKKIINYFIKNYNIQFMQMKYLKNKRTNLLELNL